MSKQDYDYLKTKSDYELVNSFNRETSHNGWVSERGVFLSCLFDEFKRRDINIQSIEGKLETRTYHSLKYPVFLDNRNGVKTLVQIT